MTDYNSTNRRYLTTRQTRALVEGEAINETGDETIGGVKTFTSSPIVPAPTADMQAANKAYVDENAGGSTNPIEMDEQMVLKAPNDANFGYGILLLDGDTASTENRMLGAPAGLTITANLGSDGLGDWVPSITLADTGHVHIQAQTFVQLQMASRSATLKADNMTSSREYQMPDASGTLALESGASGTFTSQDSKTVTVVNGIITSIA